MLAATAAAEPLEDPPGVCSGLCGLRVFPGEKYAHSVVTVLPRITAPDARSIFTTAASLRGVRPFVERAAVLGRHVAGVDDVLEADRYPAERPDRLARAPQLVRGTGLRERMLLVEEGPRLHGRLDLPDALEAGADQLFRREARLPGCVAPLPWRSVVRQTSRPSP
jgi:hypothetical protein